MMSGVLVDTGSSLNVMPRTTLARLTYQGPLMRPRGVIIKAFDGSRKTVIGEVDLPMTIGLSIFQITFQVMDIRAAYSCLLGRPWIHEAEAVTSTLHQKLKYMCNGQLVTVCGEKALLVSNLSSFSYVDAEDELGTQFQTLSIVDNGVKNSESSMTSFKDAQRVLESGSQGKWGQVLEFPGNKYKKGLGFTGNNSKKLPLVILPIENVFLSGGDAQSLGANIVDVGCERVSEPGYEASAIIEDGVVEDQPSFVTHGGVAQNWRVVNVPIVLPLSK